MLALFGKKKITDTQISNYFVVTTLDTVERGWPEVAGFINDSLEFESQPQLASDDYGKFLMIVIAANINTISSQFDDGHDKEIIRQAVHKFAEAFDISPEAFASKLKEYREFLSRVNHPSKNTLYAMSKGIFFKYNLNVHQIEYFRSLNTPNPIFLRNMDELMIHFLWDWKVIREKYKVIKED
ncbi:MAG: hypothetical protein ACFCUH_12790 [Flavobacteriales bacterium]